MVLFVLLTLHSLRESSKCINAGVYTNMKGDLEYQSGGGFQSGLGVGGGKVELAW